MVRKGMVIKRQKKACERGKWRREKNAEVNEEKL